MLKTLSIDNFTVFKDATLEFSKGLNVIIGENGSGKSHLLKLAYAILKTLGNFNGKTPPREVAERAFAQNLVDIFRPDALGRLASRVQGNAIASIVAEWGQKGYLDFSFSTRKTEKVDLCAAPSYESLQSSMLFIPPKEILSIFEGLQAALESRELAFDATYLDLAKALNAAPLKGKRPSDTTELIESLESILNASIVKQANKFYFIAGNPGGQMEAPLVAEGHRKLGMLAYLILNGALRNSSSLFWDEPEANLNPRLLKELALILAKLSQVMQVTIATHSLFLLRELEILNSNKTLSHVKYFGLHLNGNSVCVAQGKTTNDIGEIAALDANLEQSDRYIALADRESMNA